MYNIMQMACCMKEEARDIGSTVADIEDWLDRIKQLAEEVSNRYIVYIQKHGAENDILYHVFSSASK